MAGKTTVLDDTLHWYKDAIIYELHIKAFRDGNGDGVGDFRGLLEKLDYLQDLGVTAVWVLPFYPSPLRDDGYDIADYYNIHASYGDIHEFQRFLKEAHQRNLKVITELVINHTSDQHPWFGRARQAPKGSLERAYYVWTDDPKQYQDVRIIFQDFEASNWTWDPVAGQYYWHRFFHHQPDLNYDNPLVQEEIFKIIDYWCGLGVDGFRLDAVPYLFEREGTNGENLPETHAFLKKLRAHVDAHFPGTVLLAEANMWPEDSASYFGEGDECHMNYHFPVMPRMFMALRMEDRYPITDIFDQTPAIPDTCQWAIFLRNHDELTLEMVTDEERDYMYKVYARDPKAKINLGIRRRLAPLMENNRRKIELLNCLLFSLPGTPVIYYGDEIGMGDNVYLGDRDGVRTPMQWSPDRNAGFSETNPQRLYLPIILDPEYHYETVNVETQRGNPSSLLWFMKRTINVRKKYKAFSRGDLTFINVENPKVLAFTRCYEDEIRSETVLVVVNLSRFSQAAEMDLGAHQGYLPVEVVSKNRFPAIKESPYFFTLSPNAYHWFVLEKAHPDVDVHEPLSALKIEKWTDLASPETLKELETTILPGYLMKTKWFGGKGRTLYSVGIVNHVALPLPENSAWLLLIEVNYQSGLPETYQLPVAFAPEPAAGNLARDFPQAVLARLAVGDQEGLLCDALFTPPLQRVLLAQVAGNGRVASDGNTIEFHGNEVLGKRFGERQEVKAKIHAADSANTSIAYDNGFLLKMYRQVDRATNPDLEITRFLSEGSKFEHIPALAGAIEWKHGKEAIVLGVMQGMTENHGDGYAYMLERMNNFVERVLAHDKASLPAYERRGTLIDPVGYDQLPEDLRVLLGGPAAEQARLIGIRTAQLHLALASGTDSKDFQPEDFSLHYQRSIFSSLQAVVRETYQSQKKNLQRLPEGVKQEAEEILARKEDVLNVLKRIYARKLEVVKIRIHGNYHLKQVLFTGKDVVIQDFGGDPARSYSERRLKRSPLRDVAAMVRSFHNVAYEGLFLNNQVPEDRLHALIPFAQLWAHYVGGFFVRAYLDTAEGSSFVPKEKEALRVMLHTYLLEKALRDLNDELNHRPDWAIVPIRLIQSILRAP
ncbi:MAG: maltose alpha-D-glucosyltransferase [Ferruginibacter sp.]|nr:maltose alpha-D-glucosyltransferase [Cytophagales bacterium]